VNLKLPLGGGTPLSYWISGLLIGSWYKDFGSLWRRANTRNVSFQFLYGGQLTSLNSNPKFCVSLLHRRSIIVSLEANPAFSLIKKLDAMQKCRGVHKFLTCSKKFVKKITIPPYGPADAILNKTHWRISAWRAERVEATRSGKSCPDLHTSSVDFGRA